MSILSIPPRKHRVSHKKSERVTIESIRNGAAARTAQSRRRWTFRQLATELAVLTLASNKEILANLKKCARYVTTDSTADPTLPFKGEDEWISQITQALGTGFSAKARAALRTTILTMDTPILRERHGQLAAESPEAYVHLAVRTLPVCYLAPQHGHQSTSRILVAIFHLREQRLSLALLPLAPEWRGTSLDDLVSPQHSPLRPATIALARAAVLAAVGNVPPDHPQYIILHTQKGNDWLAKQLSDKEWTVVDDLPALPVGKEFLSVKQHWKSMPNHLVLAAPLADTRQKLSSARLPDIPETLPDLASLRPKAKDGLILALWNELARLRQVLGETYDSVSD